jgi:hypothetical protein
VQVEQPSVLVVQEEAVMVETTATVLLVLLI